MTATGSSAAGAATTGARTAGGGAPTFPPALADVGKLVEERVVALLDEEAARWSAIDPVLAEPLGALRRLVLAGGKRLRPAFCHCAFVGAGGDPGAQLVIDVSSALELVHTFALVHDDVMDGSDLRRGDDAVHRHFARSHRSDLLRGEARRYGDGMAILVGDFAFTYADVLMRGAPATAFDVYDELRIELCVGQSLDLVATARASTDSTTAQRIATYKSGKYTVERPLHLGAALAGRLGSLAQPLSEIGLPLGEAFQLRDDILGVFGEQALTGKPVGDDLREGKATPLVALTASRVHGSDAALLGRLGSLDLGGDEIAALQDLFVRSGALDEIEASITRLVAQTRAAIAAAPITGEAQLRLDELATYVAWRDR